MAQSAATGYEAIREEDRERTGLLAGIEQTLRNRGTAAQRVLCLLLMALLAPANLPGGCCGSPAGCGCARTPG